jgi:hypothetical protein
MDRRRLKTLKALWAKYHREATVRVSLRVSAVK